MALLLRLCLLAAAIPAFCRLPAWQHPTWPARPAHLQKRWIEGVFDCTPEQELKLHRDFGDAVRLAGLAYDLDINSPAYWHYFRIDTVGQDEDRHHMNKIYSAIATNNAPTHPAFRIIARCGHEEDEECMHRRNGTFAITDRRPELLGEPREIRVCTDYWTHPWTVHSLVSRTAPNASVEGKEPWCQTGRRFHWFSVGGAALLHEMTHLDAISQRADYPEDKWRHGHGTIDLEDVSPWDNMPGQARQLATVWQQRRQDEDTVEPFLNAESIAAAALESYFMKLCGFSSINL